MRPTSSRSRLTVRHKPRQWPILVAGLVTLVTMLLLGGAGGVIPLQAQGDQTPTPKPVSGADISAAAQNLYCPVCENVPLNVCYTAACEDWKAQVRDLLAQGYTQAQIEAYFAERFGRKTVGTPTTTNEQLLTIGLPFLLIGLLGLAALRSIRVSRRLHTDEPPADAEASNSPATDPYRARLEAELAAEQEDNP